MLHRNSHIVDFPYGNISHIRTTASSKTKNMTDKKTAETIYSNSGIMQMSIDTKFHVNKILYFVWLTIDVTIYPYVFKSLSETRSKGKYCDKNLNEGLVRWCGESIRLHVIHIHIEHWLPYWMHIHDIDVTKTSR